MFFDNALLRRGAFERVVAGLMSPVQLKIGIDTGATICRLAHSQRGQIFVGVEIKARNASLAYQRAKRYGLSNVIIVNEEAESFLINSCPSSLFSAVHIYFPTPYVDALRRLDPSIRHKLFVKSFVDELFRIVMPGGLVKIATDVAEYYKEIERLFEFSRWIQVDWSELAVEKPPGCLVGTQCEVAYRLGGRKIFFLELLRV
jgi:tRNA (guanine-N7-)-methyltransferase